MTRTSWPLMPHPILSMATWTLAVSVWYAKHPCFQSGYPLLQCLAIPSRFLKLPAVHLALMSSTTCHATQAVSIVPRPTTLVGQVLPIQLRRPWLAGGLTIRATLITTGSSVPSHPIFYSSTEEKTPNSLSPYRSCNQPLTWKQQKFLRKSGLWSCFVLSQQALTWDMSFLTLCKSSKWFVTNHPKWKSMKPFNYESCCEFSTSLQPHFK